MSAGVMRGPFRFLVLISASTEASEALSGIGGLLARRTIRMARDRDIRPHAHLAKLAQQVGLVRTIRHNVLKDDRTRQDSPAGRRHVRQLLVGRLQIFKRVYV